MPTPHPGAAMGAEERFSAGQSVQDLCRVCKSSRGHRVFATDDAGRILKVQCEYCGSLHRYRGGGNAQLRPAAPVRPPTTRAVSPAPSKPVVRRAGSRDGEGASPSPSRPLASPVVKRAIINRPEPAEGDEAERPVVKRAIINRPEPAAGEGDAPRPVVKRAIISRPSVDDFELPPGGEMELERILRQVIREELGVRPVALAKKWRGGTIVLQPGEDDLQEKEIPIETFFSKIITVRNRLRVLEQQVNKSDLPTDEKVKLQGYVTAAYGSLTTFNVLFAEEDDRFKGSGG